MKNPPKVCQQCKKLKVLSVYIDGSCDYTCGCPLCEYREAYKEADRKTKNSSEIPNNSTTEDCSD